MKKSKKLLTAVMSMTMALTLGVSSFANVQIVPINAEIMDEMPLEELREENWDWLGGLGTVVEIHENGHIWVEVEGQLIALKTDEKTIVLSGQTGLPESLENLEKGDTLYAYYSPMMTRSYPGQTYSPMIITDVAENQSIPKWFVVQEIISDEDGMVRVLNEEGDLIATFTEETGFTPFKTKEILSLQDIQVGSELVIWYDIVAMSYPGQTFAKKAVLISQAETITFSTEDYPMVPLRKVAESMGFEVEWVEETQAAILNNGKQQFSVFLGDKTYFFNDTDTERSLFQSGNFNVAPQIIDGSMYVEESFFKQVR